MLGSVKYKPLAPVPRNPGPRDTLPGLCNNEFLTRQSLGEVAVFDVERFIAECEHAVNEGGQTAVREILAAAIADPAQIIAALGKPRRAGPQFLHRSPRLTIMNIIWPPSYTQTPHNHLLWAEIGVYAGREDNIFWRRSGPGSKWPIEAAGAAALCAGSHCSFDLDVIHSVTNPLDTVTAGIHVYGGDLSLPPRSAWDGDMLTEAPLSHARDIRAIEAYNPSLTGSLHPDAAGPGMLPHHR